MKDSKYNQIRDCYPLLKHPEKYQGTRPITARSGWEISFIFKWLDINDSIISWKSESTIISYVSPIDNKKHKYYMDFTIVAKTPSGQTKELWIEIKPHGQTLPPKEPKRKTNNYIYQLRTFLVNQAKWETTKRIIEEKKAQGKNIDFAVITEKECPFFLKG